MTATTTTVAETCNNATITPLTDDQCSWCGFTGHTRKRKTKCTMHPQYTGPLEKGKKVSSDWISLPRGAYLKRVGQSLRTAVTRRVRHPSENHRVPTSVLCAPTCVKWTSTHWTEGAGALTEFEPAACTAPRLTSINPDLGWTATTRPEVLHESFFPVAFQKKMIRWANQTATARRAGRY